MKNWKWWAYCLALIAALVLGYMFVAGVWKLVLGIVGAAAALFGIRNIPRDVKEEADAKAKEIQGRGTTVRNRDILDRLRNGPPKTGS